MKNRTTALLSLLLAALFALAVFFACNNTTNDATPAPSEAVGSPSGEDVPPAADVTSSPSGEDEQCIEQAWTYAELANKVHGFGFEKGKAEVRTDEETGLPVVKFENDSEDRLDVYFKRGEGGWEYAGNQIGGNMDKYPELIERYEATYDSFYEEVIAAHINFTRADVEAAGYKLDGTENDLIKIAEYCVSLYAERHVKRPEADPLRSVEAAAGNLHFRAKPLIPGERWGCFANLYYRPENPGFYAAWQNMDLWPYIADSGEHAGWISVGCEVDVHKTEDGFEGSIGFNVGRGTEFSVIDVSEDPMETLKFAIPIVLEPGEEHDRDSIAYHVIRTFHGMEWEKFEELFGADAWERLYPILVDNSTTERDGPDDDYQKYYNMHVLLGAVNAPEKYHKGLAEILKHQRDFDKEIFDRCVGYLDEAGQKKIEAILGK